MRPVERISESSRKDINVVCSKENCKSGKKEQEIFGEGRKSDLGHIRALG